MAQSTHLEIFTGLANQFEVGTSFPTTREDPMYIVGNDDGLDDGDAYYISSGQVLGVRIAGTWVYVPFTTV